MYLTGGQFKGHKIETPKNVRPTLSKVRESVFNILQQYFPNQGSFLDMFAGSAIMGLEAISRGYIVDELEINPKAANLIKENYKKIKISPNVYVCDALKYKTEKKYDVIYVDPPWEYNYETILNKAKELIDINGIMVVEYDSKQDNNLQELALKIKLSIIKEKNYGRVKLSILKQM